LSYRAGWSTAIDACCGSGAAGGERLGVSLADHLGFVGYCMWYVALR
jgi:hypothetical protein